MPTSKTPVTNPPAKMGTPHRYWQVADSGYAKFAMKNEDRTRVAFLHGRYSLERAPNAVFAQNAEDTRGQYLVKVPSPRQIEKRRVDAELVLAKEQAQQANLVIGLQTRAEVERLKVEHARLSAELRNLNVMVSTNPFTREKALMAFDNPPIELETKRLGVKHYLQHFPCLRSKPQYTAYIKNNKGL